MNALFGGKRFLLVPVLVLAMWPEPACAWHDETHIAIAKAAGYRKWYNATGADMAKVKAGAIEQHNHYVNNPPGTFVTAEMVMEQVGRYNTEDPKGHLYGAVIASVRDYIDEKAKGKYGEYHLAFCAHYVGDLSMPLHNTWYSEFNRRHHDTIDGIVNEEVLGHPERIRIEPVTIRSEENLASEIARLANRSMALGYRLEGKDRLLTKDEAYEQIGHSASLFRGILEYAGAQIVLRSDASHRAGGRHR